MAGGGRDFSTPLPAEYNHWLSCRQKPNVLFVRLAFTLSNSVLQLYAVCALALSVGQLRKGAVVGS